MRPSGVTERKCETCGKSYSPQSNRQRWCGIDCRLPVRRCQACQKPFRPKTAETRTCSLSCASNLKWKAWGKIPDKPCPQCGKPVSGSQRKAYCSRECAWAASRRPGKCYLCGKPTSHTRNRYCSHECAGFVAGKQQKKAAYEGRTRIEKGGYIQEYRNGRWRLQHRLVMTEMLGRPLLKSENVHHKN